MGVKLVAVQFWDKVHPAGLNSSVCSKTLNFVPVLDVGQLLLSTPLLKPFGRMLFFLLAGVNSRLSSSEGFFLMGGCEEHPQILSDQPAPPLQTSVTSRFISKT